MRLNCGEYHNLFNAMEFDTKPNQKFLKFISIKGDKKKFSNLELLLNLEKNHSGIFAKVMSNFDVAKSYRESLDENGNPINIPWEEALNRFYISDKYEGVTKENLDIAKLFEGKGLTEEVFRAADQLRKKAKKENIPEHILGEPLREETILESIERIKKQTDEELKSGKEMIEELYTKQFTYEWLSKNDPHNAIMGLFCSCCGTITNRHYGKNIAEASIIAPDVQNLVIRNSKGEIISKGTMYVNKDKGYAVINDFELNKSYKRHEIYSGKYFVDETSSEEQDREMIFKAFQRGLEAFIEKYNEQNPEKPLTQINIGLGYNRLKKQVERYKRATLNLTVPAEYCFKDANIQYILYQRGQEKKEEWEEQNR